MLGTCRKPTFRLDPGEVNFGSIVANPDEAYESSIRIYNQSEVLVYYKVEYEFVFEKF